MYVRTEAQSDDSSYSRRRFSILGNEAAAVTSFRTFTDDGVHTG